ncbi:endonuclease [Vibrio breoganii]|uniref:Endonuclease n=1 Tax=Vibrio breoganii TaxID=553239 RepID=A0AAJ5EHL4_9VIBR|nr:GIY-YIG nuclease family protein [Vibrio breoganii]ANO35001.1 endonuclease [Vibrio breoganii]MDN3716813.1 GIY-YIG nuclease family protein [Vibrio breoganii]NMO75451.1 GIY-YIG nuclease family protein [Vibrio breoganii]NMR71998.1 GIY-YIG nuclease family protein [Vibrio breoganii]OCH73016.1 endonuclease [Vibrio breoganii]
MKAPCVYILSSINRKVLYIGVTSNLKGRVWQHKSHYFPSFTSRYHVTRLVYFEVHDEMEHAIEKEKKLKFWRRSWKDALITEMNPEWNDLYETL